MEEDALVQTSETIKLGEIVRLLREFGDIKGASLANGYGLALTNQVGHMIVFVNLKAGGDTICNHIVAKVLAVCGYGAWLPRQKWLLTNPEFTLGPPAS